MRRKGETSHIVPDPCPGVRVQEQPDGSAMISVSHVDKSRFFFISFACLFIALGFFPVFTLFMDPASVETAIVMSIVIPAICLPCGCNTLQFMTERHTFRVDAAKRVLILTRSLKPGSRLVLRLDEVAAFEVRTGKCRTMYLSKDEDCYVGILFRGVDPPGKFRACWNHGCMLSAQAYAVKRFLDEVVTNLGHQERKYDR